MGKKSVDKMSFGGTNISIGGNVKGVRLKYFSHVENSTSKYLTSFASLHIVYNIV